MDGWMGEVGLWCVLLVSVCGKVEFWQVGMYIGSGQLGWVRLSEFCEDSFEDLILQESVWCVYMRLIFFFYYIFVMDMVIVFGGGSGVQQMDRGMELEFQRGS